MAYDVSSTGLVTFRDAGTGLLLTLSSFANAFQWQGQYLDVETGLMYAGARYYSPALGRFIQVDPLGAFADARSHGNPYTYGANNAINNSDDGHLANLVTAAIGSVAGFVIGGLTTGTWEGAFVGAAAGALAGFTFGATLALSGSMLVAEAVAGAGVGAFTGAYYGGPEGMLKGAAIGIVLSPISLFTGGMGPAGILANMALSGAASDGLELAMEGSDPGISEPFVDPAMGMPIKGNIAKVRNGQLAKGSSRTARISRIKSQGFQEHHIVSSKNDLTKNHELLKLAGYNLEERSNKIFLPKRQSVFARRSIHSGRHSVSVSRNLQRQMSEIVSAGKSQGWSKARFREALLDMISEERQLLRSGQRALNKNMRPGAF